MQNRRQFLRDIAALTLASGVVLPRPLRAAIPLDAPDLPRGTIDESILSALDGKKPLIKRTFRPPNYETPVSYFNQAFTPNDAFFVRYHLANIPTLDTQTWRLRIGGEAVERPLALTLAELKDPRQFEPVELAAVCQCSGNRRGLNIPHVSGVQWGYGAMGHARFKGVRLKDVLARSGVKAEALEVTFNGADAGVLDATPDFVKSLPLWKALDENTLIAFEMNGEPLPPWNGYPARLVVPGWTATYWMKHLVDINVVTRPFDGFWMKTAYRIPLGKFPLVDRFVSQETEKNTPITEMVVNSLITNVKPGQRLPFGRPVEVKGIAWDGGYGIRAVEVSIDGGRSWRDARLDRDYGRYGWRQWRFGFRPAKPGRYAILAKATNRAGSTQTFELIRNPAGYHHNVPQKLDIVVA